MLVKHNSIQKGMLSQKVPNLEHQKADMLVNKTLAFFYFEIIQLHYDWVIRIFQKIIHFILR
jgi:hypothetical protein